MFKKLIEILKAHPRKIVFTEGTDTRILEASPRLLTGTYQTPVLEGNAEKNQAAAQAIARAGLPERVRGEAVPLEGLASLADALGEVLNV